MTQLILAISLLVVVFFLILFKDSSTHMHGLADYAKEGLQILICVFDWLYFPQCLTSFSSIHHLLRLYAQFLILFHLT